MTKALSNALSIVLLAIIIVSFSFYLPTPETNEWLSFHTYLAVTIAISVLNVGASIHLIMGLESFSARFKRSYVLIGVGFSLLGLSLLQLPVVIYFGGLEDFFRNTGLVAVPIVAALVILFLGMRNFTRLFGIKNLTTSVWFAFVTPVILGVLFSFVPHEPTATRELDFDVANAFSVLNSFIVFLGFLQTLQVRRVAGSIYTRALSWLAAVFGTMTIAGIGYLTALMVFGDEQWFAVGAFPLLPTLLASLLLVGASYAFNQITEGTESGRSASLLDVVTYAASLVSDTRDLERTLDTIRAVSVKLKPGQPLPATDESLLKNVYLEIEQHLLHKEKVRAFTQETLHQEIAKGLGLPSAAQRSLWSKLAP